MSDKVVRFTRCGDHKAVDIDPRTVYIKFELGRIVVGMQSVITESREEVISKLYHALCDPAKEPTGDEKVNERTATFETVGGPKTYTAKELQFCCWETDRVPRVSKQNDVWHTVTESRADFVRKLHGLFCTEPGDETVGEMQQALNGLPPDKEDDYTVSISGNGCCIIGAGEQILAHTNQHKGSPLAAIASLTPKEPTKDELLGELRDELRTLFDMGNPTWNAKQGRMWSILDQIGERCK